MTIAERRLKIHGLSIDDCRLASEAATAVGQSAFELRQSVNRHLAICSRQ